MKKEKPQRATRGVVAYENDKINTFASVKAAAEHYRLTALAVYGLIKSGKETDGGVSFDYQHWED